jgi:hypothetical protein
MLTTVDRLNCRCGFDGRPLLVGEPRRVLAPRARLLSIGVAASFGFSDDRLKKKLIRQGQSQQNFVFVIIRSDEPRLTTVDKLDTATGRLARWTTMPAA